MIEVVERVPQSISVWIGDKMIERQLRPYLVYYKLDHDKFLAFLKLNTLSGGKKKQNMKLHNSTTTKKTK